MRRYEREIEEVLHNFEARQAPGQWVVRRGRDQDIR